MADDRSDPRRAFAESLAKLLAELPANAAAQDIDTAIPGPHLLRTLGLPATGPILVHNAAFERKHLLKLAQAFPDLAPILVAASERIIDLLPIARAHYPHPDMRSSWPLKAVAPAIGVSYDRPSITNSAMARAAFFEMTGPDTTPERRHELRGALLDYRALDTFALMRLVNFFIEHAHAR